jgi:hypothetical protein
MARFVLVQDLNVGDTVWAGGMTFEVVNMAYGPDFGARNDAGFLVALQGEAGNKLACLSLGSVLVVNDALN